MNFENTVSGILLLTNGVKGLLTCRDGMFAGKGAVFVAAIQFGNKFPQSTFD